MKLNQPTVKNMEDGRYELNCPVCGISIVPDIPCPLDKFVKIIKKFTRDHSHTAVSQEAT